ncbi:MAG: DUF2508 family protein [Clostridia bacterium]|jgi:hypothetical protein|nr:DUF2508 family protein [Clostridia bacterium]MDD4146102.1 DUF2508 family protein [Clostridia bacterium]
MEEGFSKIAVKRNPLKVYWHNLQQYIRILLTLRNPVRPDQLKKCSWVTLVEKARAEWEQSKVLFNEAKDPALIDHAIYAMEAAERKYMYLLKEARKEKVVHEDLYYVLHK